MPVEGPGCEILESGGRAETVLVSRMVRCEAAERDTRITPTIRWIVSLFRYWFVSL